MLRRDRKENPAWMNELDAIKPIDEVKQSLEDVSELEMEEGTEPAENAPAFI